MVTPGATLIDVGINRLSTREEFDRFFKGDAKREAAFEKRGSTIVGDIHPKAFEIAGAYTPVPGGVGLLTIAMLMSNTVRAAKLRRGICDSLELADASAVRIAPSLRPRLSPPFTYFGFDTLASLSSS